MKSILVNFLGDSYLENLARQLFKKEPEKFSYLFDHKKPSQSDDLSKLNFLDCTFLYDTKFFHKAFFGLDQSSFNYEEISKLEEASLMVLKSLDRITPIPISNVKNEEYFWELASYFKSFFLNNKDIGFVIFDNIPHMPFDLTLFYVSKLLNLKTLILRRTNIGGISFISEDFRPRLLNYKFNYEDNLIDIFKDKKNVQDKIKILIEREFAKSQIFGIWPEEYKNYPNLDKLSSKGLYHYLSIIYGFIKLPKLQSLGATTSSFLNSTFSRQRDLSRFKHFTLRKNYKIKLKKLQKIDEKFSKKIDDLFKIEYIFFPLHFQPERSTLPEGGNFDKQYLAIRLLAKEIDSNIKIIVKDHPKQYYSDLRNDFYRDEFYLDRISKIKNVIVVSRNHDYQSLLNNAKITASVSGSVTWQGLLKGIPGITFSDTWLTECKSVSAVSDNQNLKDNIKNLLSKDKETVFNDIIEFIETNQKYFLDTVVYSKHLRFFNFDESYPLKNLTKYLLQRLK